MRKVLALVILVVPGVLAAVGVKYMRDSMFGIVNEPFTLTVVQFIIGLLMAVFGIWFIGGYILNREKKNKRVQEKFLEKVKQDNEKKSE
ncbi:DUF2627 domain-containing protein [Corticicoccus populi]|uniref:DUF2627 domain-containing protein n=1 Tax=Corticicoccus populi TaxID=1812821 RepID=A0ABW5WT10_9STAP